MKHAAVMFAVLALILCSREIAFAHCDTMNGPVVLAAQKALETGDVNLVLIWVQPKDEAQIKEAFQKTLAVRKLNTEARTLADMYFFETLVRIHRAGEGVAYTGLKSADTEVEPGIEAADKALAEGTSAELVKHVTEAAAHGITEQFNQAMAKKNYDANDTAAGREYVEAYVRYIHYCERLFQAAEAPASGHLHEAEAGHHDAE